MMFEDYVNRFAELTVELGDESAALIVLSVESDPISCIDLISDLMHGKLDETANKLYAAFTMSEMSYMSVQVAIEYFAKKYRDKNLPEDIAYVALYNTEINPEEGN